MAAKSQPVRPPPNAVHQNAILGKQHAQTVGLDRVCSRGGQWRRCAKKSGTRSSLRRKFAAVVAVPVMFFLSELFLSPTQSVHTDLSCMCRSRDLASYSPQKNVMCVTGKVNVVDDAALDLDGAGPPPALSIA
jgi:hypothetical protein